jgi:hypothetical protein
VRNITSRYVNYTNQPIDVFARDLHNLWYLFIGAAKVTPTDDAAADRLAVQVLVAREMGTLRRIEEKDADGQIAHMSASGSGSTQEEVSSIPINSPISPALLHDLWRSVYARLSCLNAVFSCCEKHWKSQDRYSEETMAAKKLIDLCLTSYLRCPLGLDMAVISCLTSLPVVMFRALEPTMMKITEILGFQLDLC